MKIVLTREAGRNASLEDLLPDDASFIEVPLTRTQYFDRHRVVDNLAQLEEGGAFQSLVVTSERSHSYADLALATCSSNVQVFSVGPVTTDALEGDGVNVHFEGVGGSLMLAPQILHGPVLVLGAKDMRDDLVTALRERGLVVSVVACYETVALVPDDAERESLRAADVVFVGAPSAWAVAREFVNAHAWIVVPGPSTGAIVAGEHERVIEGWGPHLRQRLAGITSTEE